MLVHLSFQLLARPIRLTHAATVRPFAYQGIISYNTCSDFVSVIVIDEAQPE